jgi:hypothetical protein
MPWKDDHLAKRRAYMREWRKTHPLTGEARKRMRARSYAHVYLRRGLIERIDRQPCIVCGAHAEMHHPDYGQPLWVVWLCRAHHGELHRLLWLHQKLVPK